MEDFEVDDTESSSHADVGGEEQYENILNLKPRGWLNLQRASVIYFLRLSRICQDHGLSFRCILVTIINVPVYEFPMMIQTKWP